MEANDKIIIRGLRQNNLKNVSPDIPKGKIVVFTGVSGSGKSSIVFDAIAAESQRQINETYNAFIRGRLPNTKSRGRSALIISPPPLLLTNPALVETPAPPSEQSAICTPHCGCSIQESASLMPERRHAFPSTTRTECARNVPA